MELRRYIQIAVSRNVPSLSEQVRCVDLVYEMLSEREKEDPGLAGRIRGLLSRHEFTRTPEWNTVQEILSVAVKATQSGSDPAGRDEA